MQRAFLILAKRKYDTHYVKKFKTDSGGEVRVYDEAHIKARWKKKVKKIKELDSRLPKLRKKYKEDLKSDDPKVSTLAAVVCLIDLTAMRVGNDNSVDEFGTFGATTLKKKHCKINGNKLSFHFPGKKKVDQKLKVNDAGLADAIKTLCKDKKDNDFIFAYDGDKRIRAKVVNRYLADFDITAKDLRGYHANRLMKEELKHTKDFDEALEEVADHVGHEPKTLMNQYLDPALVKKYKKASFFADQSMQDYANESIRSIFGLSGEPIHTQKEYYPKPSLSRRLPTNHKMHITSPYGRRIDPITGKPSGHEGLDIGVKVGTPVYAFSDGVVSIAGPVQGFGLAVYINHGKGLQSIYGHLSKPLVTPGQKVTKGQQIALSGNTGRSTGPHLHFQLVYKNKTIDPTPYLETRPII